MKWGTKMPEKESFAQSAHTRRQQPSRKVFDVSRPGRTPAGATSRPVIVGHKPQVQDPMMSKPLHVVDDAANALHVPDEPLLLAHNPDDMAALPPVPPAPVAELTPDVNLPATSPVLPHFAAVEPATSHPEITPEQPADSAPDVAQTETLKTRDVALDDAARGDLAALAVEGITEIDDSTAATPIATDIGNNENAGLPEETQPAATPTPLPKFEDDDEDLQGLLPTAADMGHTANSDAAQVTQPQQVVVADGKSSKHVWAWVFSLLLLLAVAAVVVDLLLDGGFITIQHLPHTHFF